jgi:flagellar biosynthesis protein FliQ
MSDVMVIDIGREALLMLLYMAGPMLILALIVGLTISLFQAATQLNEMTLTFIPKIISVGLALLFFLPTMIQIFKDFYFRLMQQIPNILP